MNAKEIFIKHWNKVTKLPCDDAVMAHMQYCLDAMEEYATQQVNLLNKPAVVVRSEQLICPECENQYPHSHADGSYSCEECGHTWAN